MPRRFNSYLRLINHPWRILGIVLAVVFVVEALVMLVLPLLIRDSVDERARALLDATMLTLVCAPVLWWIIIGPLRRVAIVEQTRSETIAANANEGIITVNRFGNVLSFNRAAELLFGYNAAGAIGKPLKRLLPNCEIAATNIKAPVSCDGVRRSGDRFPAALSISPLPAEIDDAFVVIVRDLTELQRTEQLRIDAAREKEAMRTQQMATLAQLATGVAHEIRNPLTSIKMLLQANRTQLQESDLPSEDFELVESEIRRIEKSVTALLEFARPTVAERQVIDVIDTIGRTCSLIERRAKTQDVTIEISGQQPANVLADPEQLHQLFLNLSLNAFDAMPDGGRLRFDVQQQDSEVIVEATDTGVGIDDAMLDQLFEPFVTSKKHGTGLGLGICRRIAEDQGGQLTGGNHLAGGATFTLRLPTPVTAQKQEVV